jgi:crotonobetainyl-CoA:carnitine CoA-transferase CaiB-like acyl-CoA transferase
VSANGYITSVDGSDTDVVRPPVRFTDPLGPVRGEVPELGQHTEEVLLESGFSWEEIGSLSAKRAI